MKVTLIILGLLAVASSAPRVIKLNYRNLYKKAIGHVSSPKPRIIGGDKAKPNSIPWQTFLEIYSYTEGWYCGGSLISENYVVTAAHCLLDGQQAYVTLGAHKILEVEDTQIQIVSAHMTPHEKYDNITNENDIGVILLPDGVKLSSTIQVVPLPSTKDNDDYVGQNAKASGWGLTNGEDNNVSEELMFFSSTVISNSKCEELLGFIPESVLCTYKESSNTCHGDSGGPLTINDTLVGIISFGVENCISGYPSAFTRVSSFLDWLIINTDIK